jgi:hypothetical protein
MEEGGKEEMEREGGEEARSWGLLAASQPGPIYIIARGGGVSVTVFIGGGTGYTKPKARRPAGKGKKQQGQRRPASSPIAG